MKAAALVIGVVAPIIGLLGVVPSLVSAARAGTSKTVYVVALVLNLVPTGLSFLAQRLIQPA